MSSVTQTIPTLTGGLSQQPDELKIPGQVSVANNVIPDVTHGLLKRPGGKLLASISDNTTAALNSNANGKWFSYYRDETESYIGQINRDGDINMWDCSDGSTKTVNFTAAKIAHISIDNAGTGYSSAPTISISGGGGSNATATATVSGGSITAISITNAGTGYTSYPTVTISGGGGSNAALTAYPELHFYLKHTSDDSIQTLTLNDYTFLTNRTKTVEMSSTVEPVRPPEVFIDLKATAYARQYGVNLYDNTTTQTVTTATRINVELVKSSNNYCNTSGAMVSTRASRITQTTRCNAAAGDARDAYAPNVGTRVFNATDGANLTDDAVSGSHTYTLDVKDSSNNSVNRGENLYFRIRTTGQSVPFTTGSGTSQTTTYQARYTTTFDLLYGGLGWQLGDYFYVWMEDGYYKVTIEAVSTSAVQANLGLIRPTPTSFDTQTTVTQESIIGDIRTAIIATGNFTAANVQVIGSGLYITRPSGSFNITGVSEDLLRVMSSEVSEVSELPSQCKHGYVVKVANSEADEDDYYVKFFGNNNRDGDGVWEECAKPGREIEFDSGTMPIQLIRQANGTFTVSQVTWDQCPVGDDLTNPEPSFVGKTVNQLVFFRNRLVFLSDENIIMSRPGSFFNFWSKTATTFTPVDVIDLSCSSEYPAIVYDGIQINAGLLLFTKNQQFMLTTDSDILTPETAKINNVSSYNFNEKTNPVSLGTTVAFLDNANKYTRFFEMSNVLRQGEPDVIDQSKVISRYLDKDISIVSESRENSVVFFSVKDTDTIFGFRYFNAGDSRILQAWFKWKVVGNIQYHCMLDDALFIVTRNNNKDQIVKYSLKLNDDGYFVTDTKGTTDTSDDYIYRVHLDHMSTIQNGVYNPTTLKTVVAKPFGYESTRQLAVYDTDAGDQLGRYVSVNNTGASLVNVVGGNTVEIDGNWSKAVETISITNAGSGYTTPPLISFSGGGGFTSATSTIDSAGKVTAINISTSYNYSSNPTIVIGQAWQANFTYTLGSQVSNGGNLYTCTQAGTSAGSGGPTGTATTEVNDNTVKWLYAGTPATATAAIGNDTALLGYLYEMDVQIPTLYVTRADGNKYRSDAKSSLIIHRIKFSFGPLGVYSTTLKRVGKPDYTETRELALAGVVSASRLPIVNEIIETVPCYERNTNLTINVKSEHPAPATIYSLAWEGDFTNRFYSRV